MTLQLWLLESKQVCLRLCFNGRIAALIELDVFRVEYEFVGMELVLICTADLVGIVHIALEGLLWTILATSFTYALYRPIMEYALILEDYDKAIIIAN